MHKPESSARIMQHLRGSLIGKAAGQSAYNAQFPEETAALIGLVAASQVVSLNYRICYPSRGTLPAGIFALAEQPSGTGKSRVMSDMSKGFLLGIDEVNEIRNKTIKQVKKSKDDKGEYNEHEEKALMDNCLIPKPISNTTPEALDASLKRVDGWFCLASTEQGLVQTLIGGMYSDGKSNFDLMLKGFNAEYHKELRVTRDSYEGLPHGSTVCVSQDGTINQVLDNSGSTGLVERFLMVVEGENLGYRIPASQIKKGYGHIDQFNKVANEVVHRGFRTPRSLSYSNLQKLTLSPASWDLIETVQADVEPHLRDGQKYRANILRSMWSKFDMQVMKIAAAIHIFSEDSEKMEINTDCTHKAIMIVKSIYEGVIKICEQKGIVGSSSEKDEVLEYFEKNGTMGKSEREALNSLRKRKSFSQYGKDARNKAMQAINQLCQEGLITCMTNGQTGRKTYRLAR